jgi:hypothetical protein
LSPPLISSIDIETLQIPAGHLKFPSHLIQGKLGNNSIIFPVSQAKLWIQFHLQNTFTTLSPFSCLQHNYCDTSHHHPSHGPSHSLFSLFLPSYKLLSVE